MSSGDNLVSSPSTPEGVGRITAIPKSDLLTILGILLLIISTFLPWYHWSLDASILTQKLSRIDSAEAAKVGLTSTDTNDVLSTYGDISADATNDSVNFWGLLGSDSVRFVAAVFLVVVAAAGAGVLFSIFSAEGRTGTESGSRIFSSATLSILMVLIIALALAMLALSLGHAAGDWSQRHPAKDATTSQWRQDSLSVNPPYYQIVTGSGYGRWFAAGAVALMLTGAAIKLKVKLRSRSSLAAVSAHI